MATVTEKVNEILKKRKERLPKIVEKIEGLKEAADAVERLEVLKNSIVNSEGALIQNGPFYSTFKGKSELVMSMSQIQCAGLRNKIYELIEKYKELQTRFEREYINIAVVGPARQGKSRFLQSISGLDNRCIPAFSGRHCTGASSTIENCDSEKVRVELTFKTDKEIREDAQGYLDLITNGNKIISSVSELQSITLDMLNGWVNDYFGEAYNLNANRAKALLYERYIEHYSEWVGLLGHEKKELFDEDEIMTYVAQHDGAGNHFYKFVAVKSARIMKKFSYEDCGKIKMIDTVGLGSTEKNTELNMMNVIKHQSDGVVVFKRPEGSVDGYGDEAEDKIYDGLKQEFSSRKMNKWFSFVINHTAAGEKYTDNKEMCDEVKKSVEQVLNKSLISIDIIDVSDKEAVINDFLIPYLTALSQNIDEIDSIIINEANTLAEQVYTEYGIVFGRAQSILDAEIKSSGVMATVFNPAFRETYNKNLVGKLKAYRAEWDGQKEKPCRIFEAKLYEVLESATNNLPDEEEIGQMIDDNPAWTVIETWTYFLNKVRNDLTARFMDVNLSLNELLNNFKDSIVDILTEDDGGRLKYILEVDPAKSKNEWLADFSREIFKGNFKELERSFDFLYTFDISVRGFMMHKVRICLDWINPLNPESQRVDLNCPESLLPGVIRMNLKARMKDIKFSLEELLEECTKVPNESFYSTIDEFFDRLTYSNFVEDEWMLLYDTHQSLVWEERFAAIHKEKLAFKEWQDMVDFLAKRRQKSNFVLGV